MRECVDQYLATFCHILIYNEIGLLGESSQLENFGHAEQLDCHYSLKSDELSPGDEKKVYRRTVFNEVFTTATLKEIRCTRKNERKPDKDIPSAERIHIETRSRIITKSKNGMFLSVKKVPSTIAFGPHVLLDLVFDAFAYSFEVLMNCRIRRSLSLMSLHLCRSGIILWQRPLSNFIQNIIIFT